MVSHQASADTFDWGRAKGLLDPQPERQRVAAQAAGVRPATWTTSSATSRDAPTTSTTACSGPPAGWRGRAERLPASVKAAYDAGEDRRGQAGADRRVGAPDGRRGPPGIPREAGQ